MLQDRILVAGQSVTRQLLLFHDLQLHFAPFWTFSKPVSVFLAWLFQVENETELNRKNERQKNSL